MTTYEQESALLIKSMEKENKLVKAETSFENSTLLPLPYESEKDSLDLLETMFGAHSDYTTTGSIFDMLMMPPQRKLATSSFTTSTIQESSEVEVNTPATPNLSCISSSSTDDDQKIRTVNKQEDEKQNQDKHKKQLSPKKKNLKTQREPRFAFMTKSEIDHLDDGFRWRKYGQKAVKNSPFPRSYYRCTTLSCDVKKRVERCLKDPSIVVTTYEGTHIHPCPTKARGSIGFQPGTTTIGGAIGGGNISGEGTYSNSSLFLPQLPNQVERQPQLRVSSTTLPLNFSAGYNSSLFSFSSFQERSYYSSSLARDHGLLYDMVSSHMTKDPKEEY